MTIPTSTRLNCQYLDQNRDTRGLGAKYFSTHSMQDSQQNFGQRVNHDAQLINYCHGFLFSWSNLCQIWLKWKFSFLHPWV
jgi:hypothetical protein